METESPVTVWRTASCADELLVVLAELAGLDGVA